MSSNQPIEEGFTTLTGAQKAEIFKDLDTPNDSKIWEEYITAFTEADWKNRDWND